MCLFHGVCRLAAGKVKNSFKFRGNLNSHYSYKMPPTVSGTGTSPNSTFAPILKLVVWERWVTKGTRLLGHMLSVLL